MTDFQENTFNRIKSEGLHLTARGLKEDRTRPDEMKVTAGSRDWETKALMK